VAEEKAEDLGINEQLRTKLKQTTTGGEYVEKLKAICDAAQAALDKNIGRESIEKIFSDAVAEEWDSDTIVKKINELKTAP